MLETIKALLAKNAPTLVTVVIVSALYFAKNRGWLMADQIDDLKSMLLVGGVFTAHQMQSPRGPGSGPSSSSGTMLSGGAAVFLLFGCASLGHFSDPKAEAAADTVCSLVGGEREAFARDEASKLGVSFADVIKGIEEACALRPGATEQDVREHSIRIAAAHQ